MKLKEMTPEESKKNIIGFLTYLNNGFNNPLNKESIALIYRDLSNWAIDSNLSDTDLGLIYREMADNYKKYLPLCFFSIRTAWSTLNTKK